MTCEVGTLTPYLQIRTLRSRLNKRLPDLCLDQSPDRPTGESALPPPGWTTSTPAHSASGAGCEWARNLPWRCDFNPRYRPWQLAVCSPSQGLGDRETKPTPTSALTLRGGTLTLPVPESYQSPPALGRKASSSLLQEKPNPRTPGSPDGAEHMAPLASTTSPRS